MKNTDIIFVILIVFMFSCSSKKSLDHEFSTGVKILSFDPQKTSSQRISYSSWIDSIAYIPIQTDSSFLIGNIDKLLVTDDYLIVMDNSITKSVFCTDKFGNKRFKIHRLGNGPGEYIYMNDVSYDNMTNELIIRCEIRKKLLYFNMKGHFLREISLPYRLTRIEPLGDGMVIYSGFYHNPEFEKDSKTPNLILFNDLDEKIDAASYFESPIRQDIVWSSRVQFSRLNDTLLSFKPDHSNYVYHITPTDIYPIYKLDFGKYTLNDSYWKKTKERNLTLNGFLNFCRAKGYCESVEYLEGSNFCFFIYKQFDRAFYVLYSKNTNQIRQASFFQNDLDLVSPFNPIAIQDNKFFCIVEPERVCDLKMYSMKSTFPPEIRARIKETDNPIISVITIKPF